MNTTLASRSWDAMSARAMFEINKLFDAHFGPIYEGEPPNLDACARMELIKQALRNPHASVEDEDGSGIY